MRQVTTRFCSFWSLMLVSSAALAEVHVYKLTQIAQTEAVCQQTENWIVEKFARLADATVLNHGCEMNASRAYDLLIEYANPMAVNVVSTYDELDHVHGLFDSSASCEAHYDQDLAIFKNQTGLEPLLAYCFRERLVGADQDSWTMRIDGFGTPKKSPQHVSKDFYYPISGDMDAYRRELQSALEAFGAADVNIRISNGANHATVHAMYYAEKRLPLVVYNEGTFSSLQSCERYRETMREIFAKADGRSAMYFCGTIPYTGIYNLYAAGLVMQPLATDVTSIKYGSFESCEAKRAETEAAWRTGLNKNVVGSICAMEDILSFDRTVRIRMFWLD